MLKYVYPCIYNFTPYQGLAPLLLPVWEHWWCTRGAKTWGSPPSFIPRPESLSPWRQERRWWGCCCWWQPLIKSFCEKTYHQLTVVNDDLKRKTKSSASQRFHAYVWCTRSWRGVHATVGVEGTTTSNELVFVWAVQVNAQASRHWLGPITCWADMLVYY